MIYLIFVQYYLWGSCRNKFTAVRISGYGRWKTSVETPLGEKQGEISVHLWLFDNSMYCKDVLSWKSALQKQYLEEMLSHVTQFGDSVWVRAFSTDSSQVERYMKFLTKLMPAHAENNFESVKSLIRLKVTFIHAWNLMIPDILVSVGTHWCNLFWAGKFKSLQRKAYPSQVNA